MENLKLKNELNVSQDFLNAIAKVLFNDFKLCKDSGIIIAFSGGKDSQVLLHGLDSLNRSKKCGCNTQIIAAHFDHGLHSESLRWADQCRSWCDQYDVQFISVRQEIHAAPGSSIEAVARDARYQWFDSIATDNHVVVTAHHADDQAETFLLNLFQGKGLEQLAGISPDRPITYGSKTRLLRPLLTFGKSQIEQYVHENKLPWIEDPSNKDIRFYRNFIRHELLPVLVCRRPEIIDEISRGAVACRKIAEGDDKFFKSKLRGCLQSENKGVFCVADPLAVTEILDFGEEIFSGILRIWIHGSGHRSPSNDQLITLRNQIRQPNTKSASLDFGKLSAQYYDDHLYLISLTLYNGLREIPWKLEKYRIPDIDVEVTVTQKSGHGIDPEKVQGKIIQLCWRQGGEKVTLSNRTHRTSLKKLFQIKGVPPWERDNLPYVVADNDIAWVHGIGTMDKFTVDSSKYGICPQFIHITD